MTFTSPLWFIALAPWAALVAWLLSGRLQKRGVPFLNLWQRQTPPWPKPKRAWEKPPVALAALLAAMLLAIVAAAGPMIGNRESSGVTVIVDRGLNSRFAKVAAGLDAFLHENFPDAIVDLRIVPNANSTGGGDWLSRVVSLEPTAVQDGKQVMLACRQALRETNGPVAVISDLTIELNDPRLIQIAPPEAITNVGIDLLAVRSSPSTQAMVRLFNQSPLTSAELTVRADGNVVESRQLALCSAGGKRDYFVDIPGLPRVVEAQVRCDDSMKINHRAWVVRRAAWPIVQARSSLPSELTRMIEVYARHRPTGEGSQPVAVVKATDPISTDVPAVIVADEAAGGKKLSTRQPMIVKDGALKIQSVDWANVLAGATLRPAPPGDWEPIVSAGNEMVVAVRDAPVKQVWVGFSTDDFKRRPDFVVFWSAIFDWLGGTAQDYASREAGALAGNWQLQEPADISLPAEDVGLAPGLYMSGDGTLEAVNASAPPISPPPAGDWRAKLTSATAAHDQNTALADAMLVVAMGLTGISAATWRRFQS
jgi:hypothetical protein